MSVQELRRRKNDEVEDRLTGHEDLCAERYKHIDTKLANLDERMDEVKKSMSEGHEQLDEKFTRVDEKLDRQTWSLLVGMAGLLAAIIFKGHM